jgi:hypothetical protein
MYESRNFSIVLGRIPMRIFASVNNRGSVALLREDFTLDSRMHSASCRHRLIKFTRSHMSRGEGKKNSADVRDTNFSFAILCNH